MPRLALVHRPLGPGRSEYQRLPGRQQLVAAGPGCPRPRGVTLEGSGLPQLVQALLLRGTYSVGPPFPGVVAHYPAQTLEAPRGGGGSLLLTLDVLASMRGIWKAAARRGWSRHLSWGVLVPDWVFSPWQDGPSPGPGSRGSQGWAVSCCLPWMSSSPWCGLGKQLLAAAGPNATPGGYL